MQIVWIIVGVVIIALLGVLLYWQLVVAEGAYLGRRVVTWLYDRYAPRYDRVKQFQPAFDTLMLAAPILRHLKRMQQGAQADAGSAPLVLDVACGTGRLAQTLFAQRGFDGHIVALDLSARMLVHAQAKLAHESASARITWLQHDAQHLPFDDAHFAVVACLEALEFFPQPQQAISEMVRVLKPGGLLVLSNRTGPDAWKLPGRAIPALEFSAWLQQHGLHHVETQKWLIDYDLVMALK
jgi:ubiquinone/menaquinone biosynthesis C-methylase UbiE